MLWAAQWQSKNSNHIIYENQIPRLFTTKKECMDFIKIKYGYIAKRKDLRGAPHFWRMPKAIKVSVEHAPN